MVCAILGRSSSGHALAPCNVCAEVTMTAALTPTGKARGPAQWPRCRITPGCAGRHFARAVDLTRSIHRAPHPQAAPPARRSKRRLLELDLGQTGEKVAA